MQELDNNQKKIHGGAIPDLSSCSFRTQTRDNTVEQREKNTFNGKTTLNGDRIIRITKLPCGSIYWGSH